MSYLEIVRRIEQSKKPNLEEEAAPASSSAWLVEWRELAILSAGITQDSPRYRPMLAALTACDDAYKRGDWTAFWWAEVAPVGWTVSAHS